MLTMFRRHTKDCRARHAENGQPKDMGRDFRQCKCPLHVEGTLSGTMVRKALKTGNWTRGTAMMTQAEAAGKWEQEAPATARTTITEAVRTFLSSVAATSAGRGSSTVRAMRSTIDSSDPEYAKRCTSRANNLGLAEYCELHGYTTLDQLTLPVLTTWAAEWACKARHRERRIRLVRRFFKFCVASKWCSDNPAMAMEYPKGRAVNGHTPKLPFDASLLPNDGPELTAIFAGCASARPGLREQLTALTCLMRYAGLRISDAATFHSSRVTGDGSIFLHMTKTGEPLSIPMHPRLKAALAAIRPNSTGYYFQSGVAKLTTATDNWRARYSKIFTKAGITGGHPHRFRHTFAVDLLLRGVPLDQVSACMGHSSVKITEKHYLAFVAARRAQLRDSLTAAWALSTTPAPTAQPAAPQLEKEAA